jgi:predicted peptidase
MLKFYVLGKNGRINRQTKQVGSNFFSGTAVCNESHDCEAKYKLFIPKEIKYDDNGFVVIHVVKEGDHTHSDIKTQIRGTP